MAWKVHILDEPLPDPKEYEVSPRTEWAPPELTGLMQPGDELVTLMSPAWTWQCLGGREYAAIKRGDRIVAEILVGMN